MPQEELSLEPIKRSRIYEHIIEQIRTLVAEGRLKPGDQLPPERDLAATLQVSRTTVREALRALEIQGITVGKQGGGTFVRDVSAQVLMERLATILQESNKEIEEILEVRELIEPSVARLAAIRARPEHLARLEELYERQSAKFAAGESYSEEDSAFHYTLAQAAANRTLLRLQDTILDMLRESRASVLHAPDRAQKSLRGHRLILEAVRMRDGEAAFAATLQHIAEVRDTILAAARRESAIGVGE